MTRILITGSADGLGLSAARALIREGHEVVLHARSPQRATDITRSGTRAAAVVVGDLASAEQTVGLAEQVNALGRMDAVIHNMCAMRLRPVASRCSTAISPARTLSAMTEASRGSSDGA